jgi:hypothetical protein
MKLNTLLLDIASRFSSRKFLIALLGVLVVFGVPLSDVQIAAITVLISAFVGVEGVADAISRQS